MELYKGFRCHPSVCCVGENYQIIVPVRFNMLLSVKIGDEEYFNHTNGIRISTSPIQKITVPAEKLDREKKYTLISRRVRIRKAYSSKPSAPVEITYSFRPVEKTENIRIYHIADVHGYKDDAVAAAKKFGETDLLILNGDIASQSERVSEVITAYKIASEITEGSIPVVISRGNHDLRGRLAERLYEFMPDRNGKSYYTFRTGCIWGILADCGEDKVDSHVEYGHMVSCHAFRIEETQYIKEVIARSREEYEKEGVKYRLVISHVPFLHLMPKPFDIELDLYREWGRLLKENVKPDLMLSGHLHKFAVSEVGGSHDQLGQPCTVLIGSELKNKKSSCADFTGMGLTLYDHHAKVVFNDRNEIRSEADVKF